MIQAVIFDMDGTILNTIGDLTTALNAALGETGHKSGFSEEEVKLCFGWALHLDMVKAIALSKGMALTDLEHAGTEIPCEEIPASNEEIDQLMLSFSRHYAKENTKQTKPYEGILPALHELKQAGYRLAVASNKRNEAVRKLAGHYFPGLFDFAIGQSEATPKKPSPCMIEKAAASLGVPVSGCVYVGDSEVDLMTGKNAAIPVLSVGWGFRTATFLRHKGADCLIETPKDLLPAIKSIAGKQSPSL